MDIYDIEPTPGKVFSYPSPLTAELWGEELWERRSAELTPRYLHRYGGPRRERDALDAHGFWELTFAFSGAGSLVTAEGDIALRGCGAILVPPGLLHAESAPEPWDTLWIGLAGSLLDGLAPKLLILQEASPLAPQAELLWRWSRRQIGLIGPELDAGIRLLVTGVLRLARQGGQNRDAGWLARVLDMLHAQLAEPLEIPDLARVADFSVGHFQRRFKEETGETPLAYLTRLRMEEALVQVRESNMPVARIARLVGFRDPLYFSRLFRQHFHASPTQIRQAHPPAPSSRESDGDGDGFHRGAG